MEKPYLNQTELTQILGQGRRYGQRVMKDLLEKAKDRNYYIPATGREILVPTHLVKKELRIKEIILNENKKEELEWKEIKKD